MALVRQQADVRLRIRTPFSSYGGCRANSWVFPAPLAVGRGRIHAVLAKEVKQTKIR